MNEMKDIYSSLSTERDEVKNLKEYYEREISILLGKVRSFHIDNVNISSEYDLTNNFGTFKEDDISLRYNVLQDCTEYKIAILQNYLQDLFAEKKFNKFKRQKEEKLPKDEYLEYVSNPQVRAEKNSMWYQEFMQ